MHWTSKYQLFLFDFDGLLVNTEPLHYQSYLNMCKTQGLDISHLSFDLYIKYAHTKNDGVKKLFLKKYPGFIKDDLHWKILRQKAKQIYHQLISKEPISLMQGAEDLLKALDQKKIKRCVVTNSLQKEVKIIKEKLPLLQTIDHWVTREEIKNPKPSPEGYQKAIEKFDRKIGDRIIGFEDTQKGLKALEGIDATRVLICSLNHPQMDSLQEGSFLHFESFLDIF